jgi:site-specific DNA-methyltransferase (adenine-specific)
MINQVNNCKWEDGIKSISDGAIDLVLTDPPYGMSYQSNMRKVKHEKIVGDENLDFLPSLVKSLKRVCKDDAHLYIFCSWHNIDKFKIEFSKYFEIKNILIWEKPQGSMGDLNGNYSTVYEMILFCTNGNKKLNNGRDRNILPSSRTQNVNHPTEKPVSLLTYLIEKSTAPGDIVLDCFAGSFSTAQAAVATGREYFAFEMEKKYCDKAKVLLEGTSKNLFSL